MHFLSFVHHAKARPYEATMSRALTTLVRGDIKSIYPELALYRSQNECARTHTVFFSISLRGVCKTVPATPGLLNIKSDECLVSYNVRPRIFSMSWPSGLIQSISQNVCLSVRPYVCSLLRYSLNVFLPPLSKVGCPKILEIWIPWGKVMERSYPRFVSFY